MLQEHHKLFRRLHLTADLFVVTLVFAGSRWFCEPFARQLSLADFLFTPTLLIPLSVLGITLSVQENIYHYRFHGLCAAMGKVARAWLIAVAVGLGLLFVHLQWIPARETYICFVLTGVVGLMLVHLIVGYALQLYRKSGRSYKNVLIVGTGKLAQSTADDILANPGQGLHILGFLDWEIRDSHRQYRGIPLLGNLAELLTYAKTHQIDMVIFAVGYKVLGKITGTVGICNRMGLPVIVLTDVLGDVPIRKSAGEFFHRPGVRFETTPATGWATAVKTMLDRLVATSMLIVLTPIFAALALLIKVSSSGPVFYKQKRVGLNGREFTLWKFRSMVPDAEKQKATLAKYNEMSGPVFKMSNDPRATPFGRWLRRTSLDELPQLINVTRGEMSLVGPRPPLPDEVARYDGWERRRLSVKPGLTCLWQIGGRNRVDFEDWMKLDLEYIDNWSLTKDVQILAKTIPAVLRRNGAS